MLNNMIGNKRVLFIDIGNNSINLYVSKIGIDSIHIEKEYFFKKGLRNFDSKIL